VNEIGWEGDIEVLARNGLYGRRLEGVEMEDVGHKWPKDFLKEILGPSGLIWRKWAHKGPIRALKGLILGLRPNGL